MSVVTLGAALRRGSLGSAHVSPPVARHPARTAPWAAARTLTAALAITGIAEVVLFRVAAPVVSHTPIGGGAALRDAVDTSGRAALGATALLAPAAIAVLAVVAFRRSRLEAALLVGATAATLAAILAPTPGLVVAAHGATTAAAAWVTVGAFRSFPRLQALGGALLAVAFTAGRLPLVLDVSPGAAGLVPVGTVAAARTVAEAALVAAPVLLVAGVMQRARVSTRAWKAAGIAALVGAAGFAAAPEYLAITTMWASGVTLSLPPVAYIAALFFLTLLVAHWWRISRTRHLAVGIVLVAVAGIMPGVVHHNLTALAGLALLSMAAAARSPEPIGGVHG